ncbi:MAG: DUF1513 domain-containing protein [Rubrivivax sp.]|nr:DUF1513 domain-containing protein [Rubrivivax sp.]
MDFCKPELPPHRRALLTAFAMAAVAPPGLAHARGTAAGHGADTMRLAMAWRGPGDAAMGKASPSGDMIGVMELDWAAGRMRVAGACAVPTRAHGLAALAGGGFVATANRPGRWLLRCDGQARVEARLALDDAGSEGKRTLNGHAHVSADGHWLFTSETDPADGRGYVAVRDLRTLRRIAEFDSGGIDPHDLSIGADGSLWVGNGGILRTPDGRKVERAEMASALVRLHPATGALLDRFTLDDPQLSLRHLAWSHALGDSAAWLGVALQAEHAQPHQRAAAPALAVHDGQALRIATSDASGSGYAGDIVAGPGGGFVLSAQKARRVLWWNPARPQHLATVGELSDPCALVALAPRREGVVVGAARGAGRWQLRGEAGMLAWPVALAPDNHAVALHDA